MARALELASMARGRTSPNPMVGAAVYKKEKIVGEGYHSRAGEKHAEVKALEMAGGEARGADLYVNLEPCSHFGRTPPCSQAIINAGIRRVFTAMIDPNPKVAGKGLKRLRQAGITVQLGLMEKEARRLNEIYLKYITSSLPFVLIKCGMTLDGKTATNTRESRWITSESARERVHQLRNEVDAVMVGIGTVLADDPELTTRLPGQKGKNPTRVIIDGLLRIPAKSKVLSHQKRSRTILVTTSHAPEERVRSLRELGAEVLIMGGDGRRVDMSQLMTELGKKGLTSLMIEGGSEIAASALAAGIVDKVIFFIAPKIIGGREAPTAVGGEGISSLNEAFQLQEVNFVPLGDNLMVEGYLVQQEGKCSPG